MSIANYTIGIDLGGTKTNFGLVDDSGQMVANKTITTNAEKGPEAVIENIVRELQALIAQKTVVGIGIGIAGQIDDRLGFVNFAPNLSWRNVPLKQQLQAYFDMPISLLNDVRAATWGEWLYGAGKGCNDLVCLFLGTGIGSGIVSGGQLLQGATHTCGEIGHFPIQLNGPLCTCGNHGCFEAVAGGWAIAKRAQELTTTHPAESQGLLEVAKGNPVTAREVVAAAVGGDRLANQLLDEVVEALVAGCTGIVNLLNPQRLILGGGMIRGYPDYIARIDAGVRARALKTPLQKLEILPAHLMDAAGVLGAAAYVLKEGALK